MAAKARRKIVITYSNDVEGEQELNAAVNDASPAQITSAALPPGEVINDVLELTYFEIDVPAGATAVTITKPTDNTDAIILAGNNGDDGITLHPTDPDSISIDSSMTVFYLANTGEATITCRLFWS